MIGNMNYLGCNATWCDDVKIANGNATLYDCKTGFGILDTPGVMCRSGSEPTSLSHL